MLMELTERQRTVMDYIAGHYGETGAFPTLREIGKALGISSTNGVADHLNRLRNKGWLEEAEDGSRARCLTLTIAAQKTYPVFHNQRAYRIVELLEGYIQSFPDLVCCEIEECCCTPLEGAALVIQDLKSILDQEL